MSVLSRRRLPTLALAGALVAGLALGAAPPVPPATPVPAAGDARRRRREAAQHRADPDGRLLHRAARDDGQRAADEGRGRVVHNSFVADSLCCVSRSALLTGQYPHLNGVYTNNPNSSTKPLGGWRAFKQNGDMAKSFNVALKSAGYYTGFMGKYLNGYDVATVNGTKVAPEIPTGWDSWRPIYGAGYKQWGWMYSASTAGKTFLGKRPLTRKDADYSTNVMADWGVDFIKRHKADAKPYFLEISTYGTHSRTFGRAHTDDPLFPPAYADRPGHTKKYGNCGLLACPHMNVRNLPGFNDDRIDNTPVYADGTRAKAWQPNDLVRATPTSRTVATATARRWPSRSTG